MNARHKIIFYIESLNKTDKNGLETIVSYFISLNFYLIHNKPKIKRNRCKGGVTKACSLLLTSTIQYKYITY